MDAGDHFHMRFPTTPKLKTVSSLLYDEKRRNEAYVVTVK
jgi:hypothetical protein